MSEDWRHLENFDRLISDIFERIEKLEAFIIDGRTERRVSQRRDEQRGFTAINDRRSFGRGRRRSTDRRMG